MPKKFPKIVKLAQNSVPWIGHLIDSEAQALDIIPPANTTFSARGNMCVYCKGGKMLCGKSSCPLILRVRSLVDFSSVGKEVDGSSPPGVFIGRIGYPYVYAGPLVPQVHGDTALYDLPEQWFGLSMEKIVEFRMQLIRGKKRVDVYNPSGKVIEAIQELSLSTSSSEVEMKLYKPPSKSIILDDDIQPIGPSAPLEDVRVSSTKTNHKIEKAFYDVDLKAKDAVIELYNSEVNLSSIQKALSTGLFGLKNNRRLVPTRWSITASDSMISQEYMKAVKENPLINEFLVYETNNLDNRFIVLLVPDAWSYELMEAWYPGTIWNPKDNDIFMFGDSEGFKGRTGYAAIGGCYYAARLIVSEHLKKMRRQAKAIILREAHPGYIMPVGVWNVRESVRDALKKTPMKFNTLDEALKQISSKFDIPIRTWIKNSSMLQETIKQKKITDYV